MQVANPNAPMAQPGPMGEPPQADYVMKGQHEDFDFRVRAFSMQFQNPAISAQQYMQAIEQVVPAILQMIPMGLNGQLAMTVLARKLNEPELAMLLPDPITMQLQQLTAGAQQQADQDPAGDGSNQTNAQNAGPAGNRLPASQRGQGRAMTPGPGTGSPRPMQGAQKPAMAMAG